MANVNRPVDLAQKEKDINQKLQFYGTLLALLIAQIRILTIFQESTRLSPTAKYPPTNKLMLP